MSDGVEYDVAHERRARRRRALITLGVVALMLFFAFWYAYSYYRAGDTRRTAAPKPVCTTAPAAAPKPADVTLNVYNATGRAGLAARTASEVRKRGFLVATVSNDPLQKKVTGPAEVRFGPSGKTDARLVLALVKGAKAVQDARNDSSVDLVLGNAYKALAAPVKQAPAPTPTTTRAGSPTSSGGC